MSGHHGALVRQRQAVHPAVGLPSAALSLLQTRPCSTGGAQSPWVWLLLVWSPRLFSPAWLFFSKEFVKKSPKYSPRWERALSGSIFILAMTVLDWTVSGMVSTLWVGAWNCSDGPHSSQPERARPNMMSTESSPRLLVSILNPYLSVSWRGCCANGVR